MSKTFQVNCRLLTDATNPRTPGAEVAVMDYMMKAVLLQWAADPYQREKIRQNIFVRPCAIVLSAPGETVAPAGTEFSFTLHKLHNRSKSPKLRTAEVLEVLKYGQSSGPHQFWLLGYCQYCVVSFAEIRGAEHLPPEVMQPVTRM